MALKVKAVERKIKFSKDAEDTNGSLNRPLIYILITVDGETKEYHFNYEIDENHQILITK